MKGKNILFIIVVAIAAFGLATIGAWFSVYGLTKVFAAGISTFMLFGVLEFAKLVAVSFVYRFWKIIKLFQKIYFIFAILILMSITSMGIYGYLTSAFQKNANLDKLKIGEVEIYDMKKQRFQENRTYYISEKEVLDNSISELRKGLSNNVIQYTDSTGQLITTTSVSTRRALQAQLDDAMERRDKISIKLESVTDSLSLYDRKVFELESSNEVKNELGPLIYLSELTGVEMNRVINWLTLLIIFVFDPLAIMLIVALNLLIVHSGVDPFSGTKSYKKMKKYEKEEEKSEEPTVIEKTVEVVKEVPVEVIKEVIKEVPKPELEPEQPKVVRQDITQVTSHINKAQFIPKEEK